MMKELKRIRLDITLSLLRAYNHINMLVKQLRLDGAELHEKRKIAVVLHPFDNTNEKRRVIYATLVTDKELHGSPFYQCIVEGTLDEVERDAVSSWAHNALHTPKCKMVWRV